MATPRAPTFEEHGVLGKISEEMETINNQMDNITVPDDVTAVDDVLAYYRGILPDEDPGSDWTLWHQAVTYLMIICHWAMTRSFKECNMLEDEMDRYKTMLKKLYAEVHTFKHMLLWSCGVEDTEESFGIDAIEDWSISELFDTIIFMVKGLNELKTYSLGLLKNTAEACETHSKDCIKKETTYLPGLEDLCGALQSLKEQSVAHQNMVRHTELSHTDLAENLRKLVKERLELIGIRKELAVLLKASEENNKSLEAKCTKLIADCHQKDMRIKALEAELKGLRNAQREPGDMRRAEMLTFEGPGLRQSMDKSQKDSQEATKVDVDMASPGMFSASKSMTVLREELTTAKEKNKKLKKESDKTRGLTKSMQDLMMHYKMEKSREMQAKDAELEEKDDKIDNLRQENNGLKSKNADIKERLHQANLELEKLRAGAINTHADDTPFNEPPPTQADTSEEEELTSLVHGLDFPSGAAKLLHRHKHTLLTLRNRISQMTDLPGRSGWSIVQRTEAMVKEKTRRMVKNVDDCLALRDPADREKDRVARLETEGFPVLRVKKTDVGAGGALTRKKSKKGKGNKG
ncbi:hypothetical protein H2200_001898 [Cladophialophora chaetospira]|uniref:Uncharacterized protein n=1 Tax=Cladophialophora chaetospira TaxID=386627 RepID=A0AA39CPH6_9EURO|nr:hypothetical protein H2200_001898 [Cladophialophora chaetospira]